MIENTTTNLSAIATANTTTATILRSISQLLLNSKYSTAEKCTNH